MAKDTRDRILRALRHLLASGGTDAVTLEAVAAAAGVSKGGLLYHFPSKAALYQGLLLQIRGNVEVEMAEAVERSGAARGFLEYSEPTADDEAGFFTSLIAAVRTGQSSEFSPDDDSLAADLLTQTFTAWEDPMKAAVADPVQAEIIRLVGYGLYFAALTGLPAPDADLRNQVFDRVLAPVTADV